MEDDDKPVLVYATFPDLESAEAAGRWLVEAKLAGCVNILTGMVAIYQWQGSLQRDAEYVMIIKTFARLTERVIAEGSARHPYETPAFLVVPVEAGAGPYLDWLRRQVTTS